MIKFSQIKPPFSYTLIKVIAFFSVTMPTQLYAAAANPAAKPAPTPFPGPIPPVSDHRYITQATPSTGNLSGTNLVNHWISIIWSNVFNTIFALLTGIAIIMLILAGIRYISAAGNQDAVKGARQSIINIVLGIVLLVSSYFILQSILGIVNQVAGKIQ